MTGLRAAAGRGSPAPSRRMSRAVPQTAHRARPACAGTGLSRPFSHRMHSPSMPRTCSRSSAGPAQPHAAPARAGVLPLALKTKRDARSPCAGGACRPVPAGPGRTSMMSPRPVPVCSRTDPHRNATRPDTKKREGAPSFPSSLPCRAVYRPASSARRRHISDLFRLYRWMPGAPQSSSWRIWRAAKRRPASRTASTPPALWAASRSR